MGPPLPAACAQPSATGYSRPWAGRNGGETPSTGRPQTPALGGRGGSRRLFRIFAGRNEACESIRKLGKLLRPFREDLASFLFSFLCGLISLQGPRKVEAEPFGSSSTYPPVPSGELLSREALHEAPGSAGRKMLAPNPRHPVEAYTRLFAVSPALGINKAGVTGAMAFDSEHPKQLLICEPHSASPRQTVPGVAAVGPHRYLRVPGRAHRPAPAPAAAAAQGALGGLFKQLPLNGVHWDCQAHGYSPSPWSLLASELSLLHGIS